MKYLGAKLIFLVSKGIRHNSTQHIIIPSYTPGPNYSKLMTLFVNLSLKFQTEISQIVEKKISASLNMQVCVEILSI